MKRITLLIAFSFLISGLSFGASPDLVCESTAESTVRNNPKLGLDSSVKPTKVRSSSSRQ